jgi:integrase
MKGHIRERSPGKWAIVLSVRDPATGKVKRRWHSFRGTKRGAQAECARLITELKSGTYIDPSKMSITLYLDRWLEHMRPKLSPRSFERYGEIVRTNLVPVLGAAKLTKLHPTTIDAAYSEARSRGQRRTEGGLSARSVLHMHRILRQALGQAVKWRWLSWNPTDAVAPPKVERNALQTYDLAQTAELIEAMRPTRMYIPTLLAVLCGLRRGEIAALRWRHVDLDKGQLSVVESAEQTRGDGKSVVRFKAPKSEQPAPSPCR